MKNILPRFVASAPITLFIALLLPLLASTYAIASLEVEVKEAPPIVPASIDTIKWPKRFLDKWWQFGQLNGRVYGKKVQLLPGGKINGYYHENEHHWGLEQGAVVFYHSSGKPSCRFSKIVEEKGKMLMSGPFLLREINVHHALKEIDPPPLQNIQIFLGNMQSATGPDGKALFTPLPRGKYLLKIDEPGFYPLQKEITILSRQKKKLSLGLHPVIRSDYSGTVAWHSNDIKGDKKESQLLPGAKITVTPLQSTLTRNGIRTIISDFNGSFILRDLPLGKYQITVQAPGFLPLKQNINHNSFTPAIHPFVLHAVIDKREKITVKIRDALSGKPVPGARITLAEAGKTGIIQEKTAGKSGNITFTNIAIGYRNLAHNNRLAVSRPQLTITVEAKSYAPQCIPITLPDKGITVSLAPNSIVREKEPNNSIASAQKIIPGTIIATAISKLGDKDFFLFHLDYPAKVTITTTEPPILQTFFRLMDKDGKEIARNGQYEKQNNQLIAKGLAAGTYLLQVEEWDNNNKSDIPIKFQITAENIADALEPDNSRKQARLITIGQEVRATILPIGDQDWFRFHINRPGRIRFLLPAAPFQRHLCLFQEGKKEALLDKGVYGGSELYQETDLLPGEYFLRIEEWDNDNESLIPYILRIDYLEDDGIDDPSTDKPPFQPIRTLDKNGFAASSILPVGDSDFYKIQLPGPGRLHIKGKNAIQMYLNLYNKKGKKLLEKGSYGHAKNSISYDADASQTLYLKVTEWDNDNASTELYSLQTHWQPADNNDQRKRNDIREKADLIKPGDRLRHTIFPLKDKDFYHLAIDHPGFLHVKGKTPADEQIYLRWLDDKGQPLGEKGFYGNCNIDFIVPAIAGSYFLQVEEWDNDNSSIQPYDLEIIHQRAEPGEKKLDDSDPPRTLKKDIARNFSIDWNKDIEHFHYLAKAGEKVIFSIKSPLQSFISITDEKGEKPLFEKGFYEKQKIAIPITAKKEGRLDLRIMEWDQDGHSAAPALIIADKKEHDLPLPPTIVGVPCGENPGTTCFTVKQVKGQPLPETVRIDTNANGRFNLNIDLQKGAEYQFKKPGIYAVTAEMIWEKKEEKIVAHSHIWADASRSGKRIGIELSLDGLKQNEVVEGKRPITLFALPSTGAKLSRIVCTLDGKPLTTLHTPPFSIDIPWLKMGAGKHQLRATAFDSRGKKKNIQRSFTLSPYFGLRPDNGAKITGENVRILWSGQKFGPASVRYRQTGTRKWHTVKGESGRLRSVLLRGLTPGKSYQYQAISSKKPSETRTITLLKGLAFGKSDYGANIKRDYNQRVGISVRNNGDKELNVRLECGKPADPLLLAGFVGEGSEDKPFILKPKEERQFMLGISAQDVNTADHSFPVKIISDSGLADEAMVNLHVRLPIIKLAWKKLGNAKYGLGEKYRIINKGDTITDLSISNSRNNFYTVPAINHGHLPSGSSVDITVYPRLSSGFTKAEGVIIARGMGKSFRKKISIRLPEGEKLFKSWLIPGVDAQKDKTEYQQCLRNLQKAENLDPEKVDWGQKEMPEDLDLDGKPDRWTIFDIANDLLWVGDDSDGDGDIDFIHADQGMDGIFEFSAFRKNKGWQRTNLVEAWLEMGFSLPWSASSYKPHDVDIVFNDEVIGSLRDTIPNGNYSFRIPPHLVRFNSQGMPEGNKIGINTKHLRGGHYVVNSDYRFTFRLTATPVWSTGKTAGEALQKALNIDGLSISGPDYSISSSDMRLIGPPPEQLEPGMDLKIEGKIHNLGASSLPVVPVVLYDTRPGRNKQEMGKIELHNIPMNGKQNFQIPWKSRGGQHTLELVVDPEHSLDDGEYKNNSATMLITIPGDDEAPELSIISPGENIKITRPVTKISVKASDIQGLAEVEASIDGGLWQKLQSDGRYYSGKILLQPGEHILRARATDLSGNITEKQRRLSFSATKPDVDIIFPHPDARIKARSTKVMLKVPPTTVGAAARVEGGPWFGAKIAGNFAKAFVPLHYGNQQLEVILIRQDGIIGSKKITVTCTRQPRENDKKNLDTGKHRRISIEGLGRVPLFGDWNLIVGEQ